jgi:multisubunit Na+/H+ antiporter MnhC subunit
MQYNLDQRVEVVLANSSIAVALLATMIGIMVVIFSRSRVKKIIGINFINLCGIYIFVILGKKDFFYASGQVKNSDVFSSVLSFLFVYLAIVFIMNFIFLAKLKREIKK